jgi:site-specific recombinase XerD
MKFHPRPLEKALRAQTDLLATTLSPQTVQSYGHTVRLFMAYLRESFPEIRLASQLRRDPHILGWLEYVWRQKDRFTSQPLSAHTRAAHLIRLRKLFDLLADHHYCPRPGLLRSEDLPRPEQTLPRPLNSEDDFRLQQELRRRNDLEAHALLLTRLTGMRPGEMLDVALDCLHHAPDGHWLLRVPAVKVRRERWVPIDQEVQSIVARMKYLRTLPAGEADSADPFLLPRSHGRHHVGVRLRETLLEAAAQIGIAGAIVPYQLRHTFATSMLRAGVSLPALMKLLGHRTANVTLRYVEITQLDVRREFDLARLYPRHLIPVPAQSHSADQGAAEAPAVVRHLSGSIRVMDLYRQQAGGANDKPLQFLLRRLVRVRSRFEKLTSDEK